MSVSDTGLSGPELGDAVSDSSSVGFSGGGMDDDVCFSGYYSS